MSSLCGLGPSMRCPLLLKSGKRGISNHGKCGVGIPYENFFAKRKSPMSYVLFIDPDGMTKDCATKNIRKSTMITVPVHELENL